MKPNRLDLDPSAPFASKQWKHWMKTFENYIGEFATGSAQSSSGSTITINKLNILVNCVSHQVYDYIEDCTTYDEAKKILESLYVKPPNKIFARHVLATTKQQQGQSLDEYLQMLRNLSKDCGFEAVTAEKCLSRNDPRRLYQRLDISKYSSALAPKQGTGSNYRLQSS